MIFVVLCPGTPEGSTGSGSGFKASQKTGQRLKVSSDTSLIMHYKTKYHISYEYLGIFILYNFNKKVSMIRKYHNHTLQINQWHCEKEPQKNKSQDTWKTNKVIGVAPITQVRTCVIKIVTFKGGHPMW